MSLRIGKMLVTRALKRVAEFTLTAMILVSWNCLTGEEVRAGERNRHSESTVVVSTEREIADRLQRSMIWTGAFPSGTQAYVAFRKTFELDEVPTAATLRIFADSRYMLWINGAYVERGPCRFDPARPEYDVLDVTAHLGAGPNLIAVVVHHYAVGSAKSLMRTSSRIMDHDPGLTVRLDVLLPDRQSRVVTTDNTWLVSSTTRFLPSPHAYASIPDNIDCRLDDGAWWEIAYDDSHWHRADPVDGHGWGPLQPRAIPLLREDRIAPSTVVQYVVGYESDNEPKVLDDSLPMEMAQGHQLLIDIGPVAQAYTVLEFEAEEGTRIEVGFSLRKVKSIRVPVTYRKNVYIACEGQQTYMSWDTFGFKYLVISVASGCLRLDRVAVVNRLYPYVRLGRFESSDSLLNRVWDMSVTTTELCSEDAYVDCIDRERAQWIGDAVAMAFPLACVAVASLKEEKGCLYRDVRLLRNALRHVALSQMEDGRVQSVRPSDFSAETKYGVIDDFAFLWVRGIRDLHDASGDLEFVREVWPNVVRLLDYYLGSRAETGLVSGSEFFIFTNPVRCTQCQGATLNSFFYGALRDAAYLADVVGDPDNSTRFTGVADDLFVSFNEQMWEEQIGSYHSAMRAGEKSPPTAHTAVATLFFGLVPEDRRGSVYQFMNAHRDDEELHCYAYRYAFEVMYMQDTAEADQLVLDIIRDKWEPMTGNETGTVSEHFPGSQKVPGGSKVHNFGAAPGYFLSAYVLGVRTTGPFERRSLLIQPRLGDLTRAKGAVLTEFGPVSVCWELTDNETVEFRVEVPEGVTAEVHIPKLSDRPTLVLDGDTLVDEGRPEGRAAIEERFIVVALPTGVHSGTVAPP